MVKFSHGLIFHTSLCTFNRNEIKYLKKNERTSMTRIYFLLHIINVTEKWFFYRVASVFKLTLALWLMLKHFWNHKLSLNFRPIKFKTSRIRSGMLTSIYTYFVSHLINNFIQKYFIMITCLKCINYLKYSDPRGK